MAWSEVASLRALLAAGGLALTPWLVACESPAVFGGVGPDGLLVYETVNEVVLSRPDGTRRRVFPGPLDSEPCGGGFAPGFSPNGKLIVTCWEDSADTHELEQSGHAPDAASAPPVSRSLIIYDLRSSAPIFRVDSNASHVGPARWAHGSESFTVVIGTELFRVRIAGPTPGAGVIRGEICGFAHDVSRDGMEIVVVTGEKDAIGRVEVLDSATGRSRAELLEVVCAEDHHIAFARQGGGILLTAFELSYPSVPTQANQQSPLVEVSARVFSLEKGGQPKPISPPEAAITGYFAESPSGNRMLFVTGRRDLDKELVVELVIRGGDLSDEVALPTDIDFWPIWLDEDRVLFLDKGSEDSGVAIYDVAKREKTPLPALADHREINQ
jgi:hypothetical protein